MERNGETGEMEREVEREWEGGREVQSEGGKGKGEREGGRGG